MCGHLWRSIRVNSRLFRTLIAALVLTCAARIVTSAQSNPEAAKVKNPVASSPESIAAGKTVYTKCAPCHGANGQGGPGNDLIPAAPSLVDDTWDHGSTDGEIFDSIKNGVAPDFNMVPWKDQLKDNDIWNVINYIRSIAQKK
jgi:cytochrome c oxidase cbb3-type subunit 3